MSMLRIREAIFDKSMGEHVEISLPENGFLYRVEIRLARGETGVLNRLKGIIEKLMDDENIKTQLANYNETKRRIDSGEFSQEFLRRLTKLIENWERFHEFKPQI